MDEVRKRLERVDRNDVPILIRGGAGSGEEVLARIINKRYPGEMTSFCMVALDGEEGRRKSTILASQGDYSDPEVRYPDALPENNFSVGSRFFDAIAESDPISQRKLVLLLHGDWPLNVKATGYSPSPFRVICSIQQNLEQRVHWGSFRDDLFYSIDAVSLYLPPLRERCEDNPGLAYYFGECCRKEFTPDARVPSSKMIAEFKEYSWSGSVRELANLMKCYALFSSEENIVHELDGRVHESPSDEPPSDRAIPLKSLARQEVQSVGRKIILRTLRATRWNRRQTPRPKNQLPNTSLQNQEGWRPS